MPVYRRVEIPALGYMIWQGMYALEVERQYKIYFMLREMYFKQIVLQSICIRCENLGAVAFSFQLLSMVLYCFWKASMFLHDTYSGRNGGLFAYNGISMAEIICFRLRWGTRNCICRVSREDDLQGLTLGPRLGYGSFGVVYHGEL